MSKNFSSVRALFAGKPLAAPVEDDDHNNDDGAQGGAAPKPNAGPTLAQVEQATASEVSAAVTASNERWNTVMTSDAGAASPKAAARLLMAAGGTMATDEVLATLGDIAPTNAANADKTAGDKSAAELEADRLALAKDPKVDPKTGGAGGSAAQRRGEGDEGATATLKERRAARAAKGNKTALAKGGKPANG